MLGVGGFFVWWGNEYYDLELMEETKERPKILSVLVLGAFLLVIGLASIAVGLIPKRLLISIYSMVMILTALACIVISIVIFVRMNEIGDTLSDRDSCRDNDFYEEADDDVIAGSRIFCTAACPCQIDSDTDLDNMPPGAFYGGSATSVPECPCTEGMILSAPLAGLPAGTPISAGDCKVIRESLIDTLLDGKDEYFDLLEWMEEKFDCSGLCTEMDYYLFSDINRGNPDDNCRDAVNDWLQEILL
jgi:hypothetical protein